MTTLPVAVGFGISTPEQARQIGPAADGVVVGSALVQLIGEKAGSPGLVGCRGGLRRLPQGGTALMPVSRVFENLVDYRDSLI